MNKYEKTLKIYENTILEKNIDQQMLKKGKHYKIMLPKGKGAPLYTADFNAAKEMVKEYGKGTKVVNLKEGKEENKEKDGAEYKAFFKKTLKKFGVTEPDQLKGDKKKAFFDAIDKGWKADKETDVDESKKLDEVVGGKKDFTSKKFNIKEIIETLRGADSEMVDFNVAGSQNMNIKNIRAAISSLRKIKNF